MKESRNFFLRAQAWQSTVALGWALTAFLVVFLCCSPRSILAQSDNFNDGDDVGWSHADFSSRGGPAGTFMVTNGTYRLYYLISSNEMARYGFPRVASYRSEAQYNDFYLQVDLIDWERQEKSYAFQAFGLMARGQSDIQRNELGGYFFVFAPSARTNKSGVNLIRFDRDETWCVCAFLIPHDPFKKYRLVFTGQGTLLEGQIYDVDDLTAPIEGLSLTDTTYESGVCGLWGMDIIGYFNLTDDPRAAGRVGPTGPIDAAFDDYIAAAVPPPIVITRHPASQTVLEGEPVTLSVEASGAPPHAYHWMKNGVDILGANKARYSTSAAVADSDANFSVRVANAFSEQTSSNAVLTILSNLIPPRVVRAVEMLDLTKVVVTFSKPMVQADGEDVFNYQLAAESGEQLAIYAAQMTNSRTVLLTTEARAAGVNYVLTVWGLRDDSSLQLEISPNPTKRDLATEVQLVMGDMQAWSYFQSNRAPGIGWQGPAFDDRSSGWAIGPALFDGILDTVRDAVGPDREPVRSRLNLTNPPTASEITRTYYFRTQFALPRPSVDNFLKLRAFVDDGAVFYLNGVEIFRFNMPHAPTIISYETFSSAGSFEVYVGPYAIPVTNLIVGKNIFAAEVHQNNLGSPDISFAAQLTAILSPMPARLEISRAGERVKICWRGAGYLLEEAQMMGGPWNLSSNQANPQTSLLAAMRFYRLRQ